MGLLVNHRLSSLSIYSFFHHLFPTFFLLSLMTSFLSCTFSPPSPSVSPLSLSLFSLSPLSLLSLPLSPLSLSLYLSLLSLSSSLSSLSLYLLSLSLSPSLSSSLSSLSLSPLSPLPLSLLSLSLFSLSLISLSLSLAPLSRLRSLSMLICWRSCTRAGSRTL